MKFILAFDSFKGCMSAHEACEAARRGLARAHAALEVISLPLSDGGEGFSECLGRTLKAQPRTLTVRGPMSEPEAASYYISEGTAFMDVASACGLCLLPAGQRDIFKASSYGVGQMLLDAVAQGCRRIVIGLGGSATCDGGRGIFQCLEEQGIEAKFRTLGVEVIAAADVTNPLFGENGAAYVFAPQKGALPHQLPELDWRLRDFAAELEAKGLATPGAEATKGAGAAGGIGFALTTLCGAKIVSGVDLLFDCAGFEHMLQDADLVLTGEGCSDAQTLMGKAPSGVLHRCKAAGIPVALLSGKVEEEADLLAAGFSSVRSINEGYPSGDDCMDKSIAAGRLEEAAANIYRRIQEQNQSESAIF